jgi:hypothetical protein
MTIVLGHPSWRDNGSVLCQESQSVSAVRFIYLQSCCVCTHLQYRSLSAVYSKYMASVSRGLVQYTHTHTHLTLLCHFSGPEASTLRLVQWTNEQMENWETPSLRRKRELLYWRIRLRPLVLLIGVSWKWNWRWGRCNDDSSGLKHGPRNFDLWLMLKRIIWKINLTFKQEGEFWWMRIGRAAWEACSSNLESWEFSPYFFADREY